MAAEELESAEFEFEWSFDNISQLINLYETFPCLYAITSKDHKNRDMRDKALTEIAAKLGLKLKLKFCGFCVFFVAAS